MIIKLFLSLLAPLSIGFLLLQTFLPLKRTSSSYILLKASLGVGLGFGITSCSYFLCLLMVGPTMTVLVLSDLGILVLLIFIYIYLNKGRSSSENIMTFESTSHDLRLGRILSIGFYSVLALAFMNFIFLEMHTPHGAWDSWAIWNLRARFIFRGGEYWRDAFSSLLPSFQHADYPLLVPLSVSRSWTYIGKETQVAPIVIAFFFTFATVGIIYSALTILRSKRQGFLGGIFLLSATIFISLGAYQYADVPTGFFFLASIALLFFQEKSPENFIFSLFSGMMAGLSGWTKNEGLLFCVCLIMARLPLIVFFA